MLFIAGTCGCDSAIAPLRDRLTNPCVHTTRVATVVVHVDDPGLRRDRLGDLVGVARGRDAGADVEELADPGFGGEEADGPPEERPVGAGSESRVRIKCEGCVPDSTVGGVVVPAAQVVIVYTRDAAGIVCA